MPGHSFRTLFFVQTILLSAFSCAPRGGSELAVGWEALENVRGRFRVVIVIDISCQKHFLKEELEELARDNVEIHFFDKGGFLAELTRKIPFGRSFYYWLWQAALPTYCWARVDEKEVSLIHHVTWAKFTIPTRLARGKTPLIIGPVGGGETFPYCLSRILSPRGLCLEVIRTFSLIGFCRLPGFRKSCESADLILAATNETKSWIERFAPKSAVKVMTQVSVPESAFVPEKPDAEQGFQVLSVGRFLDWKGFSLVIRAFFLSPDNVTSLVLVGDGPERKRLEKLASNLKKDGKVVSFTGWLSSAEVGKYFQESNIFSFGSLHDSGGFVVLEAMAAGLPVVCMDCGGPSHFVTETTGAKVSPKLGARVEEQLSSEMKRFADMTSEDFSYFSNQAKLRARQFSSKEMRIKMNSIYQELGLVGEVK